jgi:hypothetical protein
MLSLALAACGGEARSGGPYKGTSVAPADNDRPDCADHPLDCDDEDNDCDGEIDEGAEREGRVLSGNDQDGDSWSSGPPTLVCPPVPWPAAQVAGGGDCDDTDASRSPGAMEHCLRGGDEDCDGAADCADLACAASACVEDCADGLDNDADGGVDCADDDCHSPACAEDCAAPGDEDGDGLTNCEDADCADVCVEDCMRYGDEDGDGRADCADEDCALRLRCWRELNVHLGGAGRLSATRRREHSHRHDLGRLNATLQVSDVRVSGTSAEGGRLCAAHLPSLTVTRTRSDHRDSIGSSSGSFSQTIGTGATALNPDCPALVPSETRLLNLRLQVFTDVYSAGEAPFWVDSEAILTGPSSSTRWAALGLHLGPSHRTVTRHSTMWGPVSTSIISQTALIDGFLLVE